MTRMFKTLPVMLILVGLVAACSNENPQAVFGSHPQGWLTSHSADALANLSSCASCHGVDFGGSGSVPGCTDCHLGSAPTFSLHPDSWATTVTDHQAFAFDVSWTTCATAECHGADLRGGGNAVSTTGPSCFTATGCHSTADNSPPPPHSMPNTAPADHGPDAKNYTGNGHDQLYCRNCHGTPLNSFNGGFVTDAVMGRPIANGACSAAACHPDAKAHPTEWQGTNDQDPTFLATHRTVDQTTVDRSCSLCHKTNGVGAGPLAGAPSCFSASFTNANGIASACHANGPGVAPHATDGSYRNPDNHGPDAKTNLGLNFCKDCHAQLLPGGSYRFNIAIGQLINGCEDCHVANAAHPPAAIPPAAPDLDHWTFRGDPSTTRRTHFASATPLTNCTLCHGANLDGVGGTGPSCYNCHDPAVAPPNFALQCTACHATPPDGVADNTGGNPVDHTGVSDPAGFDSAHDACTACHGAKDDGTGRLAVVGTDYQLFDRTVPSLAQGGDHLDGNIEMNGPAPATGAGYNETTFGCDNACHSGNAPFRLSDSSLTVEYGSYGNQPGSGCTFCHGYPPDGSADLTGAPTPVNHTGVSNLAIFLTAHNDCSTCHGVKDDGTGSHLPTGNYDVATDHQDGNINLNLDTQYDPNTFGCDAACHPNAAPYQLTDSGLNVVLDSYGSGGGGGACDACHTSGAGGAPIVIAGTSSHTGSWTCEECHTGHGAGTVIIPNNAAVGIDYPNDATHLGGISLGGSAATGATEAQICWNCHDVLGSVSEWGENNNAATGGMIYNYGSVSTSNWTAANWSSAQPTLFAYKSGAIMSTHSVNAASGVSGVDAVGDIRCSYCHDVHDLNLAPGDAVTGQPYLRGTWKGNPYKEDGAPQAGTSFQNLSRAGPVPRGNPAQFSSHASGLGGYQIDQNNGFPTWSGGAPRAGWQPEDFAGLCELCHGNGDGTWSASEIDNLNQFGTASSAWVGTNGHANSVIGGTGAGSPNASNIFDLRGGSTGNSLDPAMAFFGANNPGNSGRGFRGRSGSAGRWLPQPTTSKPRIYQVNSGGYEWGATVNSSTIDNRYHHFPCSKCHSPHAARLPRLMITNCLDTKHNTWDDSYQLIPAGASQAGPLNEERSLSNWTSAQNCHRLGGISNGTSQPVDPGAVPGTGNGWNTVTPFE